MTSVAFTLADFRLKYSNARVGERLVDATDVFSSTKCRIIVEGIAKGDRVYALPVEGGKGMFSKWMLDPNGKLERGKLGGPKIDKEKVVPFLLCAPGTRFLGSDEIYIDKELDAIEGIRRRESRGVFELLGLNPETDAYALFIRAPETVKGVMNIFRGRLRGILKHGYSWKPYFKAHDVFRIARKIQTDIRKKLQDVEIFLESGDINLQNLERFQDVFDELQRKYFPGYFGLLHIQLDFQIHSMISFKLAYDFYSRDLAREFLNFVVSKLIRQVLTTTSFEKMCGVERSISQINDSVKIVRDNLRLLGRAIKRLLFEKPMIWGMEGTLGTLDFIIALRGISSVYGALCNEHITILLYKDPKLVVDKFVRIISAAGISMRAFDALSNKKIADWFTRDPNRVTDIFIEIAERMEKYESHHAFSILCNDEVADLFVREPQKVIDNFVTLGERPWAMEIVSNKLMTALFAREPKLITDSVVAISDVLGSDISMFPNFLMDEKIGAKMILEPKLVFECLLSMVNATGKDFKRLLGALTQKEIADLFAKDPKRVTDIFVNMTQLIGGESYWAFTALCKDEVASLFAREPERIAKLFVEIASLTKRRARYAYPLDDESALRFSADPEAYVEDIRRKYARRTEG